MSEISKQLNIKINSDETVSYKFKSNTDHNLIFVSSFDKSDEKINFTLTTVLPQLSRRESFSVSAQF